MLINLLNTLACDEKVYIEYSDLNKELRTRLRGDGWIEHEWAIFSKQGFHEIYFLQFTDVFTPKYLMTEERIKIYREK